MSKLITKMESRWSEVNNLLVHARVSLNPEGAELPPIVLVHGLGVSSRYMVPLAEHLGCVACVYAPDLPGFGKSATPARALNIDELADALAAWMHAMKLDQSVLLGNSFGSQVVVALALRHPERIARAVLVAPTMDPRAPTVIRQIMRLLRDAPREPLSLLPLAIRDYLTTGLRRGLQTLRYAIEDHIENKLPHVHVPTLVVGGARDPVVPRVWVEEVAGLLPHGRAVLIPRAAHAVNYNSPQELAHVVQMFMDEQWTPVASVEKQETSEDLRRIEVR